MISKVDYTICDELRRIRNESILSPEAFRDVVGYQKYKTAEVIAYETGEVIPDNAYLESVASNFRVYGAEIEVLTALRDTKIFEDQFYARVANKLAEIAGYFINEEIMK